MPANDTASDGNTAQWDKLKAARQERGEPSPGTPVVVKGLEPAAPATPPPAENRDPETGQFTKKEAAEPKPGTVTEPPAEPKPAEEPSKAAAPTTPAGEEVEIEPGVKVVLDPSLAAVFKKADEIKTATAATADREALKAELREELKKELAPPASTKTQAELDAEAAIKAAEEAEKNLPPEPDSSLLISDPDKYHRMNKERGEAVRKLDADRVRAETKREVMADLQKQQATAAQDADVRARGILREQFYAAYPVLRASADLVDPILNDQFNAIMTSGKLARPMTPAEGETLKATEFADVAKKATVRLVKLKGEATKITTPPTPPPNLASSAPAKAPAPKKPEEPKPREKYPEGSVSRLLRKHQDSKSGASA